VPLSRPLAHERGTPLLRRLADQIRVACPSELLMRLLEHFAHWTKNGLRFFRSD